MTYYDYKVVPAPRRARKVKGISGAPDLFALTLAEAINEVARQGWEYCGSETLTSEAPGGWFRRGSVEEQAMLVFRRPREHLSPRLAAAPVEPAMAPAEPLASPLDPPRRPAQTQPGVLRREPRIGDEGAQVTPLRPVPQLGPADQG